MTSCAPMHGPVSVADAVSSLTDRLMILLACADVLIAHGDRAVGQAARRPLMRAIHALSLLQREASYIEIFERLVSTDPRNNTHQPENVP